MHELQAGLALLAWYYLRDLLFCISSKISD